MVMCTTTWGLGILGISTFALIVQNTAMHLIDWCPVLAVGFWEPEPCN